MDDKKLTSIMDSIQSKVGEENSAQIQDDLGLLITGNSENLKRIENSQKRIEELEKQNRKLVQANANLFAQIPDREDIGLKNEPDVEEVEINPFDAFDENGNFKK